MPHSSKSTHNERGERCCSYCGYPLADPRSVTCRFCRDLPGLEPFDDRYVLTGARMTDERRHGTASSYRKGCRCDDCKAWSRDYKRRYRSGVRVGRTPTGLRVHGLNGYCYHKCRCETCRAANTAYYRRYRARKRQALEA